MLSVSHLSMLRGGGVCVWGVGVYMWGVSHKCFINISFQNYQEKNFQRVKNILSDAILGNSQPTNMLNYLSRLKYIIISWQIFASIRIFPTSPSSPLGWLKSWQYDDFGGALRGWGWIATGMTTLSPQTHTHTRTRTHTITHVTWKCTWHEHTCTPLPFTGRWCGR